MVSPIHGGGIVGDKAAYARVFVGKNQEKSFITNLVHVSVMCSFINNNFISKTRLIGREKSQKMLPTILYNLRQMIELMLNSISITWWRGRVGPFLTKTRIYGFM